MKGFMGRKVFFFSFRDVVLPCGLDFRESISDNGASSSQGR